MLHNNVPLRTPGGLGIFLPARGKSSFSQKAADFCIVSAAYKSHFMEFGLLPRAAKPAELATFF
jgi:hypothetical protein